MKQAYRTIARIMTLLLVAAMVVFGFSHSYTTAVVLTQEVTNAEVKFVVYPDGNVGVSSKGNHTFAYEQMGPAFQMKAQVSKSADKHNLMMNATLDLPPEELAESPFNTTTATLTSHTLNNVTTSILDASLTLSDTWDEGGDSLDIEGFPFNSTDFSVDVDYADQAFDGTLTFHFVPGLSLADVDVDFTGNLTYFTITDAVTVFYNYTMPIPDFPEINETTLTQFLDILNSTLLGTGEGTLYNMTEGVLECTTFDYTITPIDANSAEVSFSIVIEGDFIQLLANLASGPGEPPMPPEEVYSALNSTIYSVDSASLTMSYSHTARTLDVHAILTDNIMENQSENVETLSGILSTMYPPEAQPYIELMLNTTYISLYSSSEKITYSDGHIDCDAFYTFSGDLNAEANHLKDALIDWMNATEPGPEWVIATGKATDLDVTGLVLEYGMDNESVTWDVQGLTISPPADGMNATAFRLERLFDITSSLPEGQPEPPLQNDTMKIVVQGGSNGTHSVTLHIDPTDPDKPPEPDAIEGSTFTWNNQSISGIRRLIFTIWEGQARTIYDPTSVTPANPYTVDARPTANCTLILNSISESTTICVKTTTAPTGSTMPGTYKLLGDYMQIMTSQEGVALNATLRIYYTSEQLSALGLDENSLKIHYWNSTSSQWTALDTQINTSEHYAWAMIDHLSTWALLGQAASPIWQQMWFLTAVAVIVIVVILAAVLLLTKRKQPSQKTPEKTE